MESSAFVFLTSSLSRTSREAKNEAARLALQHLTVASESPSSSLSPTAGDTVHFEGDLDSGYYLSANLPGLRKQNVKVYVEANMVIIKAERRNGRCNSWTVLPAKLYNVNEATVNVNNGILKVIVPKVQTE